MGAALQSVLGRGAAFARIAQFHPELTAFRRDLHAHPELGFEELYTSARVVDMLKVCGVDSIHTGIGKTGVVALVHGQGRSASNPGRMVGLRADMDALPIQEETQKPYASEHAGTMHACGHDAHTAMLLGAAKVLAANKDKIAGTVVFVFQPAEEGSPGDEEGGAPLMIKEGALDNPKVDAVFGLHISSETPVGTLKYKAGAFMASSDWFTIKVNGKGSHGSQPWGGVDPIASAAQIIEGLQHIVSRQMNLITAPVVITVGTIKGGVRSNIIPETAELTGTIRTLDSKMQTEVHERIRNTVKNIAASSGATADVTIDTKTLVTYNEPSLVKKTLPSLFKAAGANNVFETTWQTGAEDFSFFSAKAPSFFFYLGALPVGKDPKDAAPHHTPNFYIDESGFTVGVKAFCNLVFDYAKVK